MARKPPAQPLYRVHPGGTAKKDRLTHRVDIASPDEIDDTVRTSLARAYERDA